MIRAATLAFVVESNHIEGIKGAHEAEVIAHEVFLDLPVVTTDDLQALLGVLQPDAGLRDRWGHDVQIGGHIPPPGGPFVPLELEKILMDIIVEETHPYAAHHRFEALHPFTDGNGRTGRALWLWQMINQQDINPTLGFLHTWYYQSLASGR